MQTMIKKFSKILLPVQKKGIVYLFLGSLLSALIDTGSVALMMPFMTAITNPENMPGGKTWFLISHIFGCTTNSEMLIILSLFFILLYLFRGAYKIYYNYMQAKKIAEYRIDLSTRLFSYVMNKPYAYHLSQTTSKIQRLVGGDVNNCFALLNQLLLAGSSLIVSICILVFLFSLNPGFTIGLAVLASLFIYFTKTKLKKTIKKYADANFTATATMGQWVQQAIGGLKSILVKRAQGYFVKNYSRSAKTVAVANSRYIALDSLPKVLIDTACMVAVFSVVIIQLLTTDDLASTLPMFATFAIAALRLIPVMGQITSSINSVSFYRPSVDAIYNMLQSDDIDLANIHPDTVDDDSAAQAQLRQHPHITDNIQVRDLTFRFPDAETPLYSHLSLTIPAKQSVAFVGTTGSGKTTLADIILGLQIPSEGHILVDGIDIHEKPDWWAAMVGYIPQFIYLCNDTIRANVAFGIDASQIDDELVWECLERTQMKKFVEELPKGIYTVTGENGIRLSGGQRQRIGIARALYTKPQFLLMDEATSSLDGETEKAIVDSINTLSGDITLLIIAHRLTTIENCNLIYRIENGKATLEKGTLEENRA